MSIFAAKPVFFSALLFSCTCLLVSSLAFSQQLHVVGQVDKTFTVNEIRVKVGDTVEFFNEDPFFHNVYSLSDAALFDLGSFPQGEGRKVTFDHVGKVTVECAIHPAMKMIVVVE